MADIRVAQPLGAAGSRSSGVWRGIVVGGTIAGVVDIFAAAAINHINPGIILQFIATGLIGKASLQGGLATMVLGFVLQVGMSLIIAAIYGLASLRLLVLVRRPFSLGALFGVGVFIVMSFVVVPLSAAPHPKHAMSVNAICLNLAAMILFGLIVAVSQSRLGAKRG